MRTRVSIAVLAGLAVVALAGDARGDAISGPPACPPGARGESSHSGTWCAPAPCTSDADCAEDGAQCRPWRVCTRTSAVMPGGRMAYQEHPTPSDVEMVVGSCAPEAGCTGDEEPPPPVVGTLHDGPPHCATARYCVPPALPSLPTVAAPVAASAAATPGMPTAAPVPAATHGCGCRVAAAHGGAGALLVTLVVVVLARRRSRR